MIRTNKISKKKKKIKKNDTFKFVRINKTIYVFLLIRTNDSSHIAENNLFKDQ